jgi:hypothetical protein
MSVVMISAADPEASRKESQVSLWRDEYGTACNTTAQAKEEGWQNGLKGEHSCTPFHPCTSRSRLSQLLAFIFQDVAGVVGVSRCGESEPGLLGRTWCCVYHDHDRGSW